MSADPKKRWSVLDITGLAGLLADASRSTMLQALMDRRARTAGELARLAKIAPSTASRHLSRLTDGELLAVEPQGRHRHYRLANPQVAVLLESMMAFAPASLPPRPRHVGFDLRFARTCYDHLAGTIATALYDRLRADGTLSVTSGGITLTPAGDRRLRSLGIDTETLQAGRRPLARACLDWITMRADKRGSVGRECGSAASASAVRLTSRSSSPSSSARSVGGVGSPRRARGEDAARARALRPLRGRCPGERRQSVHRGSTVRCVARAPPRSRRGAGARARGGSRPCWGSTGRASRSIRRLARLCGWWCRRRSRGARRPEQPLRSCCASWVLHSSLGES